VISLLAAGIFEDIGGHLDVIASIGDQTWRLA
jgi:hypothetical protein